MGATLAYDDFVHRMLRRREVSANKRESKAYLYDSIRKRWVRATPEEQVRQYTIYTLIEKGYPRGRIGIEKKFRRQRIAFAVDILVYGKTGTPHTVVECKRYDVPLNSRDLLQASAYKKHLGTQCMIVSNGQQHLCYKWHEESKMWQYHTHIPSYTETQHGQ